MVRRGKTELMCEANRWVQWLDEAEPGGEVDHETGRDLSLLRFGRRRVPAVVEQQQQRIIDDVGHRRREVWSSLGFFAELVLSEEEAHTKNLPSGSFLLL